MKKLTDSEEEVMKHLWDLKEAFVKDILEKMKAPRPAYNTVSTIVRILEKKGFVGHKAFGKSHQYYPVVTKEEYRTFITRNLFQNYFDNSFQKLVAHFASREKLSSSDAEKLREIIKKMEK